jgi:DNA-binding NarL/FixJ family response regulator
LDNLNRIILADNQIVFRAGAARALATGSRIVGECDTASVLLQMLESLPGSVALIGSGLVADAAALEAIINRAATAHSHTILITETGETVSQEMLLKVDGAISRNVSQAELIECVDRVAQGQRAVLRSASDNAQVDVVGARVRDQLTPKELQIVALIVQGCKNKEIAAQLDTKEQVIKNYLCSIYDKTGVSDRLELALFTVHHRMLAEAAAKAGHQIRQKQNA